MSTLLEEKTTSCGRIYVVSGAHTPAWPTHGSTHAKPGGFKMAACTRAAARAFCYLFGLFVGNSVASTRRCVVVHHVPLIRHLSLGVTECDAAVQHWGLRASTSPSHTASTVDSSAPDTKVQTETKTLTLMHLQPTNRDDDDGGATGGSFSQTTCDALNA